MVNNMIKRKAELILKYMQDGLTGIEQIELDNWVGDAGENRALFEKLTGSSQLKRALAEYAGNKTKTWEQIAALIAEEQDNATAREPLN
jgi:hypothetical protein